MQSKVSGITNIYCISKSIQKVCSIHQSILDYADQILFEVTFSSTNIVSACKKISFGYLFIYRITPVLESCNPADHTNLNIPTLKNLNQILVFQNLYQYVKNQFISLFCTRDTVDLKILQSDAGIWACFRNQIFSKQWICTG